MTPPIGINVYCGFRVETPVASPQTFPLGASRIAEVDGSSKVEVFGDDGTRPNGHIFGDVNARQNRATATDSYTILTDRHPSLPVGRRILVVEEHHARGNEDRVTEGSSRRNEQWLWILQSCQSSLFPECRSANQSRCYRQDSTFSD